MRSNKQTNKQTPAYDVFVCCLFLVVFYYWEVCMHCSRCVHGTPSCCILESLCSFRRQRLCVKVKAELNTHSAVNVCL